MAISTVAGIISGLQPAEILQKAVSTPEVAGVLHSTWYTANRPAAASAPTPGISGAALTSPTQGQIPFQNPASGNAYISSIEQFGTLQAINLPACVMICDRLWHNSGIVVTTTTSQAITSAAWPARDRNGSTNGEDVMVGIEVSTATTNAAAVTNTTLDYTNSAGTAGRTGTIPSTWPGGGFPATCVAGTLIPFCLQDGDTGVRSVENITLGTDYGPSGSPVIHLVAYRVLAISFALSLARSAYSSGMSDALRLGLPRCYDNTVPWLVYIASSSSNHGFSGRIQFTHG